MAEPRRLDLPAPRAALAQLLLGEEVRLFGPVFTARDATHVRLLEMLERDGELPFGLRDQVLFYAGPTPALPGRPAGSVGPTTSSRMDAFTPALLRAGIAATIGKGPRSREVAAACRETSAVYFTAVGGAAALLGRRVVGSDIVAWPELGTEALTRLELADFPAFVAIDSNGNDLYALVRAGEREQEGER